jgi:hypothetical protein
LRDDVDHLLLTIGQFSVGNHSRRPVAGTESERTDEQPDDESKSYGRKTNPSSAGWHSIAVERNCCAGSGCFSFDCSHNGSFSIPNFPIWEDRSGV